MAQDLTHIRGLAALHKRLNEIPVKLEKNIMRAALRAGARVILLEARRNIRNRTGALKKSLRVSTRAQRGMVTSSVKSDLFYARMVEYGTRQHWISVEKDARPTRATRRGVREYSLTTLNRMAQRGSLRIGGSFVGKSVVHPGASPRPFLRPALDAKARAATIAVGQAIKVRLTKEGIDLQHTFVEGDE